MHFDVVGTIGGGGNSGYQALNLATQWGARDIALVGFDMSVSGGKHWHGAHPAGLTNPTAPAVLRWAEDLAAAAPGLAVRGVRIVDCAVDGALRCWPKVDFSDWLREA